MKKIKFAIVLLLVVVVMALGGTAVYLDKIAKFAIEKAGSYALGVSTTLDDISIGVVSGNVSITKLTVANPSDFETPYFMQLSAGHVEASLRTITKGTVVLQQLTLTGVGMNLEHRGGKSNFDPILASLKRFESSKPPADAPAPPTGEWKKFVIRRVVIQDVSVQSDYKPVVGPPRRIPIKIDNIELENVGSETGGVIMGELSSVLTQAILTAVVKSAGNQLPNEMLHGLSSGLGGLNDLEGVTLKVAGQVTDQLGKGVAGLGQAAGEAVVGVVETVGKGVEGVGTGVEEGVGALFGGKKDDKNDDKKAGG